MTHKWSHRQWLISCFAVLLSSLDCSAKVCRSNKYPQLVLDELIMQDAESFLDEVLDQYHLSINNSFRSRGEQEVLYKKWVRRGKKGNPVAKPGTSRHESGFAFDLNGLQPLTFIHWNRLLNAGEKHGFCYILGDWEGKTKLDWPHFEADPRRFGKTLEQALQENSGTPRAAISSCDSPSVRTSAPESPQAEPVVTLCPE